jgi:hypothetical protein
MTDCKIDIRRRHGRNDMPEPRFNTWALAGLLCAFAERCQSLSEEGCQEAQVWSGASIELDAWAGYFGFTMF